MSGGPNPLEAFGNEVHLAVGGTNTLGKGLWLAPFRNIRF